MSSSEYICSRCCKSNKVEAIRCEDCFLPQPKEPYTGSIEKWICRGCRYANSGASPRCIQCLSYVKSDWTPPPPKPEPKSQEENPQPTATDSKQDDSPAKNTDEKTATTVSNDTAESQSTPPVAVVQPTPVPDPAPKPAPATEKITEAPVAAPKPTAQTGWSCGICTLNNPDNVNVCGACASPRPRSSGAAAQAQSYNCQVCTFKNPASAARCGMCGTPAPSAQAPVASPNPTPNSGSAQQKKKDGWACEWCTYTNHKTASFCHSCRRPKQSSSSSSSDQEGKSTTWGCPKCAQRVLQELNQCPVCSTLRHAGSRMGSESQNQSKQSSTESTSVCSAPSRPALVRTGTLVARIDAHAAQVYNELTSVLTSTQQKFVDDSFEPTSVAIYGNRANAAHGIPRAWRRASDLFSDPALYGADGTKPQDIRQGELGDCWFLSALAVLADVPGYIEDLFLTKEFNTHGAYQIRLFKDGVWQVVLVDDLLPVSPITGELVFSRCKSETNKLWVSLIEKAYAKLHGAYEWISAGLVHEALADLTGAPVEEMDLRLLAPKDDSKDSSGNNEGCEILSSEEHSDLLWSRLVAARNSRFVMCGGCSGSESDRAKYESVGLQLNHAYSILDVRTYRDSNQEQHRLIKVRNPWGESKFTGAWSPLWDGWTASARTALNYPEIKRETTAQNENESNSGPLGDEGIFWISWTDFQKFFKNVSICKLQSGWTQESVADKISGEVVKYNTAHPKSVEHGYTLTVAEPTWAHLSVNQPGQRGKTPFPHNYYDLSLVVTRSSDKKTEKGSQGSEDDEVSRVSVLSECRRAITTELLLEPGQQYHVSILSFRAPQSCPIIISVLSAKAVVLEKKAFDWDRTRRGVYRHLWAAGKVEQAPGTPDVYHVRYKTQGALYVLLVNKSRQLSCAMKLNATQGEMIKPSRGGRLTKDILEPGQFQILNVFTSVDTFAAWNASAGANLGVMPPNMRMPEHMMHQPVVNDAHDLHRATRIG